MPKYEVSIAMLVNQYARIIVDAVDDAHAEQLIDDALQDTKEGGKRDRLLDVVASWEDGEPEYDQLRVVDSQPVVRSFLPEWKP